MVAAPRRLEHKVFNELGDALRAGDLLVFNTSATIPAAIDATRADGRAAVVHFSTALDDGTWVVELRTETEAQPFLDGSAGETIRLDGGARISLLAPHSHLGLRFGTRLWRACIDFDGTVLQLLRRFGRPIGYGYVRERWPLEAYQTVFARDRGSAEMPSAARPFSERLVTDLVARGISFAPVLLHCGVSSLEAGEVPQAERFRVSPTTARLVNETRRAGGRVIAVGTTAMRAIETVAAPDGIVSAGDGWTTLVLEPDRPARVVRGLVTGWHLPETSHLLLLESLADSATIQAAYDEAVRERYLWHEFGDSCLLFATG